MKIFNKIDDIITSNAGNEIVKYGNLICCLLLYFFAFFTMQGLFGAVFYFLIGTFNLIVFLMLYIRDRNY